MRITKIPRAITLSLAALVTVIVGCEYKNAPNYYNQATIQNTPVITQMIPDQVAGGGVNTITIQGDHFSQNPDSTKVYFDGYSPEIIDISPTSIQVYRPNLTGDSIMVKVVTYGALDVATYGPYQISSVFKSYGGFVAAREMKAIAVDQDENVYTIEKWAPYTIHKISEDGARGNAGAVTRGTNDALIAQNGKMILIQNRKEIVQKDLASGEETVWVSLPGSASVADFDGNGCLYAGGNKSDLFVVKPDLSVAATGWYSKYNILDIRVYGNDVYVLADNSAPDAANPKMAIWKHRIEDAAGTLSPKVLVLDWSTTGDFTASTPCDFTFSADGTLYVGTDHVNPILILYPDGSQDVLYKQILPSPEVRLVWGSRNYIYMTITLSTAVKTWNMIRIDMGEAGAPQYGR